MISFVDAYRDEHGVEPICKVLKFAPSTYRAHVARRADPKLAPPRIKRDIVLCAEIKMILHELPGLRRSQSVAANPLGVEAGSSPNWYEICGSWPHQVLARRGLHVGRNEFAELAQRTGTPFLFGSKLDSPATMQLI